MRPVQLSIVGLILFSLLAPLTVVRAQEPKDPWQADVGEPTRIKLYFVRDERLAVVHRVISMPEGKAIARATLTDLLLAPTIAEQAFGVGTAIPLFGDLRDVQIDGDLMTIELDQYFTRRDWPATTLMRFAQVVYTATQFPNVARVKILAERTEEGAPIESGDVVENLGREFRRTDLDDFLAQTLFEEPATGDVVGAPLRLRGYANAFEGSFPVRLVDANGTELARMDVFAAWGAHHGTFDVELPFDPAQATSRLIFLIADVSSGRGDWRGGMAAAVIPLWLA